MAQDVKYCALTNVVREVHWYLAAWWAGFRVQRVEEHANSPAEEDGKIMVLWIGII